MTPTDVDFITAGGEPAFRTSERYYDWGVKVEIMDCNGKPMAIVKENLLHSFAHTPRAEYVVELPGEQLLACLVFQNMYALVVLAAFFLLFTNCWLDIDFVHTHIDGTEIARSKQGSFLSDTFMIFDTQVREPCTCMHHVTACPIPSLRLCFPVCKTQSNPANNT
jgi:hypothetical protein